MRKSPLPFLLGALTILLLGLLATKTIGNQYYYFAAYVVLQYIVLSTGWNILGGYTGYVNFGVAGFFAIGAYTSVALVKWLGAPMPVLILAGGLVAGLVGLGTGYLTLRLKGVFFSIATLALAIVLQTFITNWDYVGGSRGVYTIRPREVPFFGNYVEFLFITMLLLALGAVAAAWLIERSWIGRGLAAIRDDEQAAEAMGVPTLRLKLFATTVSGFMMGIAGAPYPYYVTYLDPASGFSLAYAVNSVAMPLIGGTTSWLGPVIGAVLLGTLQQVATVTISSALNLLIVGVNLVMFVTVAPDGILGLAREFGEGRPGRRAAIAAMILGILAGDAGIAITGAAGTGLLQLLGIAIPLLTIVGGGLALVRPGIGGVMMLASAVATGAVFGLDPVTAIPVVIGAVGGGLAYVSRLRGGAPAGDQALRNA
jgi:branched-chain amino acid transport system permease protein